MFQTSPEAEDLSSPTELEQSSPKKRKTGPETSEHDTTLGKFWAYFIKKINILLFVGVSLMYVFVVVDFMAGGEDDLFSQVTLPDGNGGEAPNVTAAMEAEKANKREAKERLQKSREKAEIETIISIRVDLNTLEKLRLSFGKAKTNSKVISQKMQNISQ